MQMLLLKLLALAALSIGAMVIPLATALFAVGKDDYGQPLVNIKKLFPISRKEFCERCFRMSYSGCIVTHVDEEKMSPYRRFVFRCARCTDFPHKGWFGRRDNDAFYYGHCKTEIVPLNFFIALQDGRWMRVDTQYMATWRHSDTIYAIPTAYRQDAHLSFLAATYKPENLPPIEFSLHSIYNDKSFQQKSLYRP